MDTALRRRIPYSAHAGLALAGLVLGAPVAVVWQLMRTTPTEFWVGGRWSETAGGTLERGQVAVGPSVRRCTALNAWRYGKSAEVSVVERRPQVWLGVQRILRVPVTSWDVTMLGDRCVIDGLSWQRAEIQDD
jgi:hypothetical protein